MNRILHGVARAIAEAFPLPEPIVEIGSYQVEGQRDIADLRGLFPGKMYQGIDFRPGPGVDRVADIESLPYPDGSVGTIIAMNTLEHVQRYWRGLAEINRVLSPDGAVLISCPFYFKIHNYPGDFWRFTPQALDLLLEDYPTRILGWHGPRNRPANVWALACGHESTLVTPESFARYRELLAIHAVEPLSLWRKWRYQLGSRLFGRRPFQPFLEHNRWETTWTTEHQHGSPTSRSASPTGTAASC